VVAAAALSLGAGASSASAADNYALHFDGAYGDGSYIGVPDSDAFDLGTDGGASARIRWDGSPGYEVVISKPRSENGAGTGFALVVADGRPCFGIITTGGDNVLACGNTLPIGQWIDVAGRYEHAVVSLAVNGVQVDAQGTSGAPIASDSDNGRSTELLIGREFTSGLYDRYFTGDVDNVAITKGGHVVASYNLDEGSGTTVHDGSGNGHDGTFSSDTPPAWLLVQDRTAPVVAPVSDITQEATGPDGAVVSYATPTAMDAIDGSLPVSCSPASGNTFALGDTTVTCSATDNAGNTGSTTFDVKVQDTTSPVLTLPAPAVDATSPSGATVTYTATAHDLVSGDVPVICSPQSGTPFAIGTTMVSCSATDAAGNSVSGTFNVLVKAASAQVSDLSAQIKAVNLTQGIGNAVDTKLADALAALTQAKQGDQTSTCGKLGAVSNQIESQAVVKQITQGQADALSAKLRQIRSVIGC
jgi:hypothetical protein